MHISQELNKYVHFTIQIHTKDRGKYLGLCFKETMKNNFTCWYQWKGYNFKKIIFLRLFHKIDV